MHQSRLSLALRLFVNFDFDIRSYAGRIAVSVLRFAFLEALLLLNITDLVILLMFGCVAGFPTLSQPLANLVPDTKRELNSISL